MPFYFSTLEQHGGMEKKVYEVRNLLMAYAQFESYLMFFSFFLPEIELGTFLNLYSFESS